MVSVARWFDNVNLQGFSGFLRVFLGDVLVGLFGHMRSQNGGVAPAIWLESGFLD